MRATLENRIMRDARLPGAAVLAAALGLCGCGGGNDLNVFETMSGSSSGDESAGSTGGTTTAGTATDGSTGAPESSSAGPEDSGNDTNPGAICGDGLITGNEECDCGGVMCTEDSLGGTTCLDVVDPQNPEHLLTGGTLGCNPASCRFDTSGCVWCGDEEVNGELEDCEPTVEIMETCDAYIPGFVGALACNADCTIDTSACTDCGYQVEFFTNDCPWDWTFSKLHPAAGAVSWACGDPTDYSLGPGVDKTGVLGTNLGGPYNANESSLATSPELDLADCVGEDLTMTIHHWHNLEGGLTNNDGGIVQVSENGVDWTTVAPISGALYYDDDPLNTTYAPPDGEIGFSGFLDDQEWTDSVFDVTQFGTGGALHVRFLFGSDGSVQQGGWYIDRIEILGSGD
jgi:hypothetical protein